MRWSVIEMLGGLTNIFGSGILENTLWILRSIPGMPSAFLKDVIINLWLKEQPKVYEIDFKFSSKKCPAGIAGGIHA